MDQLGKFISSKVVIKPDDLNFILSHFKVQTLEKGEHVQKIGRLATHYFFILSGGFRLYYLAKKKQVTVWLAFENEFFGDIMSLIHSTPSRFSMQALEKSVVMMISKSDMDSLYKKYPEWQEFNRKNMENAFIGILEGVLSYQSMSAEERYLNLLSRSKMIQRVPLKYLSTFLGITATSLSRLRKKIR